MTIQQDIQPAAPPCAQPPVERIAQLRAALAVVGRMDPERAEPPNLPDDAAFGEAYRRAPAVAQRRFRALTDEAMAFSASAIRALAVCEEKPAGAVRSLAKEMARALQQAARAIGA